MKKIILLLLLVLVSVTASARKSYITISENRTYDYIELTGDVPNGIEGLKYYTSNNYHSWRISTQDSNIGEILNLLSEYGYEVSFMNTIGSFLLSKEISSGQSISKGDVNEDSEVNIADVNEVISLILGIVREHPEILKQIKD